MVSQTIKIFTILFAAVCCVLLGIVIPVSAASIQSHGIVVSPAIEKISLRPQQKTARFTATLGNNTASPIAVTVETQDFTAASNGKQLQFIPSTTTESSNMHSLSNSLVPAIKEFVISPGKTKQVQVSIVNGDNLAPGGHYAAVIFNVRGAQQGQTATVGIREAVSCLVFVDTSSGGTQTTTLAALPLGRLVTSLPQSINTVFTNQGNTETVPHGYVQIVGPHGKLYAQTTINSDSSMILPGSKRLFPVMFLQLSKQPLYGTFHLKVFYRHDGQNSYSIYDKKFLLISKPILVLLVIIVILIACLLYWRFKPKPKSKIVQKTPKRKYMDIVTK